MNFSAILHGLNSLIKLKKIYILCSPALSASSIFFLLLKLKTKNVYILEKKSEKFSFYQLIICHKLFHAAQWRLNWFKTYPLCC